MNHICVRIDSDLLWGREAFIFFKSFSLLLSFYMEMVEKMWQGVIDSLDVVGCNYLLRVKPQLQAIVREVWYKVYVSILALALKSSMKFLLKFRQVSVNFFTAEKLTPFWEARKKDLSVYQVIHFIFEHKNVTLDWNLTSIFLWTEKTPWPWP